MPARKRSSASSTARSPIRRSPPPPPSPAPPLPPPQSRTTATGSIASAPSPTTSSAASSPASPPRTAPAPPCSPRAGTASGARRRSSSTTPSSSPTAARTVGPLARAPSRAPCAAPSPPPSAHTRARSPSSASRVASSAPATRTAPRLRAGSTSSPPRASTSSSSSTAPGSSKTCASLRRLYLGAWRFVDTATLPRGVCFPSLRELVLGAIALEDRDLEFLITVCPVLDALAVLGDLHPLHARIASQSLRSAQFCFSFLIEVAVEDAPSLERLFVWRCWDPRRSAAKLGTRIKIGNAPRLSIVGYLEPGVHELQIGKTIIKSGTMPCPKTVIPTVQMLALHLHFGVRNEVRMLPSFLRCFPNVETLCIESEPTCEPTGNINIKFWQEKAPIECIRSHLKTLVLREFHGEENEVAFLKFVAETAQVLEKMVLVMTLKEPSAREELAAKMKDLDSARWASGSSKVGYLFSRIAEGSRIWNMRAGLDSSCNDPFYCL